MGSGRAGDRRGSSTPISEAPQEEAIDKVTHANLKNSGNSALDN